MRAKLRTHVAALMLLAPAAVVFTPQALAQRAVVDSTIRSITVNSDSGLRPGATLRFEVQGTRNARRASVGLAGTDVSLDLRETSPGVYRGGYVIRHDDKIDPLKHMNVRITHGDTTITRTFEWPASFQALATAQAGPRIERFVVRQVGPMQPGSELRFRLVGVPNAKASVDIPGVITGVELEEGRPGVYDGSYTIRRRDDMDAFTRAVATLRTGNARSTARVVREPEVARDDRPPTISNILPANGDRISERGRTHISARLADEGSGIDEDSVRLRIAGRDVSRDVKVEGNELHYRRDLDPGRYHAELIVRDKAGNRTERAWNFEVVDQNRGDNRDRDRVGGGPLPLQITSHVDGATIENSANLTLQGRTAPFASVRVQVQNVASVPGVVGVSQPVLDQTIKADGDGRFSIAVSPSGFAIPGNRYEVRMTATNGPHVAEERVTLHRRG
jgi:hypothetical protein